MTDYVLYVRVLGDWEEVARFQAIDEADGFRKAASLVPPEHAGRPIGLGSLGNVRASPESPGMGKTISESGTPTPSAGTFLAG